MENEIQKIKVLIEQIYANSSSKKYYQHTLRVFGYSNLLAKTEKCDVSILRPAALLHDIGMTIDPSFTGHVEKSALLSRGILLDLGYQDSKISQILTVISSHHPLPGHSLATIEEKILFDADNLDLIGPFGILRWIGSFPDKTETLKSSLQFFLDIIDKCEKARGSLFYTKTAQSMGEEVLKNTKAYCNKILRQIELLDEEIPHTFPLNF